MSGTFAPAYPDCVTTTSTTSEAPFSTRDGVSARVICTSRDNRSLPTPTVNTGSACDFSPASAWSSVVSDVSAPSLTTTRPGDRQAAHLVADARQRVAEPRAGALKREVRRGLQALGHAGETENACHEALAERPHQRRVRLAELIEHVLAARLIGFVGDLHAARVVEDHADEVLLRDGHLEQKHRPEDREERDGQERDARHREHDLVAPSECGQLLICPEYVERRCGSDRRDEPHRLRRTQYKLALLEHEPLILEQGAKKRVKHGSADCIP